MWNAISLVQDLNSCCLVHFLRRKPLHHGHLLFFINAYFIEQYRQGMPRGEENEIFIRTDDMEANQAIQQRIKATICHCGKICKNIHGLKIHQARMKCQVETSQGQRTGASPGETQETQGREAHPVPPSWSSGPHRRLRIRREIKSNGPQPRIRRLGTTSTGTSVKSLQCQQKVQ